jgi:hypothetical protein
MRKLSILIVLSMIVTSAIDTAFAAPPAQEPEGEIYIVQDGDWLSKIAEEHYDDPLAYPAIVQLNNKKAADDRSLTVIADPDFIEVGWSIYIPAADEMAEVGLEDVAALAFTDDRCSDVLQGQLHNEIRISSDVSDQQVYKRELYFMSEDEAYDEYRKAYEKAGSGEGGISFPIKGVPIRIGGEGKQAASKQEFLKHYRHWKQQVASQIDSERHYESSYYYRQYVRDEASIKSWEDCMASNREGLFSYAYLVNEDVLLKVVYKPQTNQPIRISFVASDQFEIKTGDEEILKVGEKLFGITRKTAPDVGFLIGVNGEILSDEDSKVVVGNLSVSVNVPPAVLPEVEDPQPLPLPTPTWGGECIWKTVGPEKSHAPEDIEWCDDGSYLAQLDLDSIGGSKKDSPIVGQALCCPLSSADDRKDTWGPTCSTVAVGGDKSHRDIFGAWCPKGSFLTKLDLDGCNDERSCPIVGQATCCASSFSQEWTLGEWTTIGLERSHQGGTDTEPWCSDGSFLVGLDLDGGKPSRDYPIVGQALCATPTLK